MNNHSNETCTVIERRGLREQADAWVGMTDDVLRRFVDVLVVERRHSALTGAAHRSELRKLNVWMQCTERCTLVTADEQQLIRYLSDWIRVRAASPKLSRVLLSMRRFYGFLCDSRVRDDNPMLSPAMVRWCEAQRPKETTIRRQRESRQVVAERDRAMLALMVTSGMEARQLIALRVGDLHLDQGYLSVRDQRCTRRMSLSPPLIDLLMRFLTEHRNALLRGHSCAHVFPSIGGRALTRSEFWRALRGRSRNSRALADRERSAARSVRWNPASDSSQLTCREGA
ncbi:tyrosine-type recombinase/integrase [Povalibacter sp.]|uniref:tyrosine-type recombinase/integrase n=1 Tax=Povalibacter sp. TaxID=1962978 RepID=UPI002F40B3A3